MCFAVPLSRGGGDEEDKVEREALAVRAPDSSVLH